MYSAQGKEVREMSEEFDTQDVLKQVVQNIQETWTALDQDALRRAEDLGVPALSYTTDRVKQMLEELLHVQVEGEPVAIGYSSQTEDIYLA
jgi:hypothetical protein